MSLDASVLQVRVESDGVAETTKALNDLAAAGAKAEAATSKIGSGAQAASKAQVDAAQQAVAAFNALAASSRNAANSQAGAVDMAAKIQAQLEKIDMMLQNQRWKQEAADVRAAASAYNQAQTSANSLNRDVDAFVASLRRQAETVGMNTKELRDYNAEQLRQKAAQLGVSQQVEGYINTLRNAKGAHEGFSLATAGSARELMVLTHEMATGQINRFFGSLIVLGERVNFLPAMFERMRTAASALNVSFGVLALGIVGVVAGVGTFVYALMKGAAEQRAFNNSLILSGNYAGMTADSMEQLAQAIGRSAGSIGSAKKNIMELASSGRFTAEQIAMIGEAVTEVEHATGKSADKMIKDFEQLATMSTMSTTRSYEMVTRHVMAMNDQYHFLTAAQFAHIQALDQEGDAQAAINETEEAYASALKERAEQIKQNLGDLQKAWYGIKAAASEAWDAMLNMGKKDTLQDEINGYIGVLNHMNSMPGWWSGNGQGGNQQKQFDEQRMRVVQALSAALIEQKKQQDAANKAGQDQQTIQAGIHAIARTAATERLVSKESAMDRALAEEKTNNELAKQAIALGLVSKNEKEVAMAREAAAKYSDEAIAKRRQDIIDHYSHKAKPKSEGLSGLDSQIAAINDQYELQKRAADNQIKLVDFMQQNKLMSDSEAKQAKDKLLGQELVDQQAALQKELSAIEAFHTKDVRLANEAAVKKANIEKQLGVIKDNIQLKQQENSLSPQVYDAKAQDDADNQAAQFIKQTNDQTQAIQAKIDAYNALPASMKAAGVTEKQMQDEITQAIIDQKEEKLAAVEAMGPASAQEVTRLKAEIAVLKDKTAAQKAWEDIQTKNNAALNRSASLTRLATDQVKMWKEAGNEIEKSLKDAFGNAGEAAGKMFKAFADGQATQIDLMDKARKVSEDKSLSETQKAQQLNDIQLQGTQAQLGSYGQMADAAATFFDRGSTGYQAMAKAAMVLHTAEVALSLIKGVNAILTQGEGDPYTAFARMAAMTALVAGLGVAVSGGSSGGTFTAADQQKIQGTGTVLGSPTSTDGIEVKLVGAKSDSIANSLKIAEKNSGLGLVVQNDMLMALQKLNDSILDFAKLAVQNTSLTGVTAANSQSFSGKAISGAGAVGGAIGGAALAANLAIGMSFAFPVLGTLVGAVLGAALGHGIIGKALSSVFGGSTSVDDTGFTVGKTTLGQAEQSGLQANQYTNTTTSGGWFSSDKHNTQLTSLGADFNMQVTQVVQSMGNTLEVAANALGIGGDAFNNKLKSFVIDIGNVSLKGMTSDQITTTLNNIFSKLGDQMAQFAFSDLQQYQKVGEGLMETVVRVANDLQQVNDVFTVLGKTIPQGLAGIAQAESLITSFGSVDNLTKGIQAYIGAIYSDQDKLAYITKDVTAAMDSLNLSSVKTKEQFKAVVDGLDLTTQAGQDLLAKLINIAPEFGQMVDGADKAATDARSALTDAYNKESQAIKDTQSKMQSLVTTLKQLASSSLLGDLSPLTPEQKYLEAKSQFETVAAKAKSGDETAQGQFESAYSAFLSASKVANASGDQYQKDFAEAQKITQQATEWAQKQVDVAKATLDALNKQVAGMVDVTDGLTTVTQAVNNLVSALGASGQAQATTNTQNAIESMFESILKRQASSYEMQIWSNAIGSGESMSDLATALSNGTPTQVRTTPVHAMISSQAATNAEVVAAINELKDAVTSSMDGTGGKTVGAIYDLISAVYDSQDGAADKTVTGVSEAVQSSKVGTTYAIQQR